MRPPRRPRPPQPLTKKAAGARESSGREDFSSDDLADWREAPASSSQRPGVATGDEGRRSRVEGYSHAEPTEAEVEAQIYEESGVVIKGEERAPWHRRFTATDPRQDEPIELSVRREERRKEKRKVHLRRLRRGAAALVAIVAVVWIVGFSPLFALRSADIKVTGVDGTNLTKQEVEASLAHLEGVSILRIGSAAEAAVTDSNVNIKSTVISKDFFHGITVAVTQRVPVGCLVQAQECKPIDAEGVELKLASVEGLIKITSRAKSPERSAAVAHGILSSLDDEARALIAEMNVSAQEQVSMVLTSGAHVKWGGVADTQLKGKVLRALLANVTAGTYDVSAPDAPITY